MRFVPVPAEGCYWTPKLGDLVMIDEARAMLDLMMRGQRGGLGIVVGMMRYPMWGDAVYDVVMVDDRSVRKLRDVPLRVMRRP